MLTNAPPQNVLSRYPVELCAIDWQPLGNAGGFSGAQLWRGSEADGCYCLRQWPVGKIGAERLHFIHERMDKARFGRGLEFVPALEFDRGNSTFVEVDDRLWQIEEWRPGKADFHENPSDPRLIEAINALASIHNAWLPGQSVIGPCPGVLRRLQALAEWDELTSSGWKPNWSVAPHAISELAKKLWLLLPGQTAECRAELIRWQSMSVPLQCCLCDIWHDHVLFTGERLTGIIDYGQVKVDCVAVDLARMLGSMIPNEPERIAGALFMYDKQHPLFSGADELVALLDHSGAIVGAMNWLRWIYLEHRQYANWALVDSRLCEISSRLR